MSFARLGVGALAALGLATLLACDGGSDGDGDSDGDSGATPASLEIRPPDATIDVVFGVPSAHAYTAIAHYADGTTADVTASTAFAVDTAAIATMSGATLNATGLRAGRTTVRGTHKGVGGLTSLTVRATARQVDAGTPPEAPGWFDAAADDPARAPLIVYPSDGTLVPPNLGRLETHWNGGAGNNVWEVIISSDLVDYRVYTVATTPAHLVFLADTAFKLVAEAQRGAAVKIVVRGLDQAMPLVAGTSAPVVVSFAREDLEGGIYYWAASSEGLYRHDFGKPDQAAEPYFGPTQAAGRCVACHAISRDGTKMIVTYDGGNGEATVIDVATRTPLFPAGTLASNFSAFSPLGDKFLATSYGVLTLRASTSGAVLQTVPTTGKATHPDFSPTGDKIVWASYGTGQDWTTGGGGQLFVQPFDDTSNTFGAPTPLVDLAGQGLRPYYPTFSPDGQWVLYNVSSEDFYDDGSAQIFVVPVDGSRPPLRVAQADVAGGLTNSWARWAPFQQETGGEQSQPLFWFTVSSKRAFGVRKPLNAQPQVWMAAFFPARAAAGEDPSRPMFWLPFQDPTSSNHIAQWTETVVPVE